jgi:hypothetical protein
MPVNFLCVDHREQILADSSLAEQYWLEWMDQAAKHHENGEIDAAIPFLGCAFELSDHLLRRSWPNGAKALSRFTAAGISLAKIYHLLGNDQARDYIIDRANERVAESVEDIRCYQLISDSIAEFNWPAVNLAIQRWYKGLVLHDHFSPGLRQYQHTQSAKILH